jgi:mono/diheme cytochrome c family protein
VAGLTLGRGAGRIRWSHPPAKGALVKRILAALVVLALSSPAWASPPSAAEAPALYKKSCASCHGAEGKGGTARAIAGKPASAVAGVVNAHAPPMDKLELTPDQIAAIGRYVSSLKK